MLIRLSLPTLLLLAALALTSASARAAGYDAQSIPERATLQQQDVDDNDDTRVEVQLVVLGIAAGTVFVLGSGAYLLRKKLGLVAPPPEQGGAGHH
jgi:hypothetical protein